MPRGLVGHQLLSVPARMSTFRSVSFAAYPISLLGLVDMGILVLCSSMGRSTPTPAHWVKPIWRYVLEEPGVWQGLAGEAVWIPAQDKHVNASAATDTGFATVALSG